jgi:hypothetical protein
MNFAARAMSPIGTKPMSNDVRSKVCFEDEGDMP